jgi:hypothetical protein
MPTMGNTAAITTSTIGGNAGNQFGQRSHTIGMIRSGKRADMNNTHGKSLMASITENWQDNAISYLELDTHADTSCVGTDCRIVASSEKTCEVTPFHPDYHPIRDVPIVQAAAAYTRYPQASGTGS